MSVKLETVAVVGILGVGLLGALWVLKKGGVAPAAAAAGAAAVSAVGSAASGAVGAVGEAVAGLPTPSQTVTDPAQARYLIDTAGWLFASKWSGAPALLRAGLMAPGSGTPPPPGSPAAIALIEQNPGSTTGDFSRMDRAAYSDAGLIGEPTAYSDPMTGWTP